MATSTDTMKAATIDRFGGADELTLHTLSIPDMAADEVLVRVDTAGVDVWDPWVREGEFAQMTGQKADAMAPLPERLTLEARGPMPAEDRAVAAHRALSQHHLGKLALKVSAS